MFGISNTFEPNTKAIAVHASVVGDKTNLIDGMSITALVSLENAMLDAVPTDAIVNFEGNDYIFIVSDSHSEEEHHAEGDGHKHDEHGHQHEESEKAPAHDEAAHKKQEGEKHDEAGHKHEEGEKAHAADEQKPAEGSVTFEKISVRKGTTDIGYSEITLLKEIPNDAKIVTKGAFFILAKMTNQGEAHEH